MATPGTIVGSLPDRLRERIRSDGPMRFDRFMEAALYDPHGGFFQRDTVGERGHFLTAPHLSPVFGLLVARQVGELWTLLGRPDPFVVVEAGAGDGTLARQILEFLPPASGRALRYVAVERGAAGRARLAGLDVAVARSLDEVEPGEVGCVIANELLDSMPVRWVAMDERGPTELYVGLDGDEFVLDPGRPMEGDLARWTADLRVGRRRLVPEEGLAFVKKAGHLFQRGYLWLIDYGFTGGERPEAPHAYRNHRLQGNVLADPGSRDITAGVDFDALAATAGEAGLTVWWPVRQREALLSLGYRALDEAAREKQVEALTAERGLESSRIYSARNRASLLVDPAALGASLVLAAGRGVDVPPRSVRRVG